MSDCKSEGLVRPVIDRNRCEGKEDCVRVCPFHVFELHKLPVAERKSLSLLGRLKSFAHGYQQALVAHGELCQACGLCVTACPEKAIKLVPLPAGGA